MSQDLAPSTQHLALSSKPSVLSTSFLSIGYTAPRRPPKVVVPDISVTLAAGELVCLIGPNGAGKSTLMRTLAGMQRSLYGSIKLMDVDLRTLQPRDLAQHLSVVLTEKVDVGILSAYALVALGRYPYTGWSGTLSPHDEEIVRWAIQAVGGQEIAARNVGELSDGERQKILIARALAQEPAVMLLDEPTAFLDLPRRAEIMQLLRSIARQTGRAVLLSTHDLDLALRMADRIWLLPRGGPLHVGAPEDLVLNGSFEAAFRSEGVLFDAYTGSFRTTTPAAGQVDLQGEGLPTIWTARALERAGFCVVHNGVTSPIRIDVIGIGKNVRWRVFRDNRAVECTSLESLVESLQA
jgi:iron complex transport system ATP-binding protein